MHQATCLNHRRCGEGRVLEVSHFSKWNQGFLAGFVPPVSNIQIVCVCWVTSPRFVGEAVPSKVTWIKELYNKGLFTEFHRFLQDVNLLAKAWLEPWVEAAMAFCKMGSIVQDHTGDGWIWVCRQKLFRHSCPFGSHKGQTVFLWGPILRYPHIHLGMSYQLQDAPEVTSVFRLLWGSNKYRQTECVLGIVREGFVWLQIQTKYTRDHMGKDIYTATTINYRWHDFSDTAVGLFIKSGSRREYSPNMSDLRTMRACQTDLWS